MSTPPYQLKAEFFKTLGHPARIRVLELLSEREHTVAELLPAVGIEPANLSQQLTVLRRANVVTSRRGGLDRALLADQPARSRAACGRADHPHRGSVRPGRAAR